MQYRKTRQSQRMNSLPTALLAPDAAPDLGGRPEYQPTLEQRKLVQVLAGLKVPQIIIGRTLEPPITDRTLRKHFADDLQHGHSHLITTLKSLVVRAAQNGSVRAQTWLLERLDPETFGPRLRLGGLEAELPLLPDGDAKVTIYLPDNARTIDRADAVTLDAADAA